MTAAIDVPPRCHPHRPDRNFDVVAIIGDDDRDRCDPTVSIDGHDLRDRRARSLCEFSVSSRCVRCVDPVAAGVARRRRRFVRLSRAVFSGAATRAACRSRTLELSLAAADRLVLVIAAGRTTQAPSHHRRTARACRHDLVARGKYRPDGDAVTTRGLRRRTCGRIRVGRLFRDVAPSQGCADRCGGGLLRGHGDARSPPAWRD